MHWNHMCMSTSGKIACCIIQTFMLHKNACQHQFKLHVAKKSMSTSSKIACCIIQDMHVAKTSMSTWIEITCCKIQDMHVATSRMSTSIDITCCKKKHVNMNPDMHVAPIKTCMLRQSRRNKSCCLNMCAQGQRGLFIGTPSVTHTLTRCGGESSSKNTRFLVTWFLHVNMHTVLYMLLVVIFLHVDCTCCMLWFLHVDVVCKKKFHEQTYVCMYWTGAGLNQICRQSTSAGIDSVRSADRRGGASSTPRGWSARWKRPTIISSARSQRPTAIVVAPCGCRSAHDRNRTVR